MKNSKRCNIKKSQYVEEMSKKFYRASDVTVCVLRVAIPTSEIVSSPMSRKFFDKVTKAFPGVLFNFNPKAEAFLVSTKGKAVCSKEDTFDSEIGENVAYAKAQSKTYSIVARIAKMAAEDYTNWIERVNNISEFFEFASEREKNYVKNL